MVSEDIKVIHKDGIKYALVNDRYAIGNDAPLGHGGFGKVYLVKDMKDDTIKAMKVLYPQTSDYRKRIERRIEENVKNVMIQQNKANGGFCGDDSLIRVYDVFRLPKSHCLVYVMELADLSSFYSLRKLHAGKLYLDPKQKCEVAASIAEFFRRLHRSGYAYKDINEGNIYFNTNADKVILDVDNVSKYNDNVTVGGTPGYMAPEVHMGKNPNPNTDLMSLAIFYYRLLVGEHFPYDGKWAEDFMMDNLDEYEPKDIFRITRGKDAVFAFDPNNPSNTIRGVKLGNNIDRQKKWEQCVISWDNLPKSVRNAFIQTFVEGKDNPNRRYSDQSWSLLFTETMNHGILTCPHCGKSIFNNSEDSIVCPECRRSFQNPRPNWDINQEADSWRIQNRRPVHGGEQTITENQRERSVIISTFAGKGEKTNSFRVVYKMGRRINASELISGYPQTPLLQLLYSESKNELAFKNVSGKDWTYWRKRNTDEKKICASDSFVVISDDLRIMIDDKACIKVARQEL